MIEEKRDYLSDKLSSILLKDNTEPGVDLAFCRIKNKTGPPDACPVLQVHLMGCLVLFHRSQLLQVFL